MLFGTHHSAADFPLSPFSRKPPAFQSLVGFEIYRDLGTEFNYKVQFLEYKHLNIFRPRYLRGFELLPMVLLCLLKVAPEQLLSFLRCLN